MSNIYLSEEELSVLTGRMEDLFAQGVTVSDEHSGEMNFSGCATGHCQAWDQSRKSDAIQSRNSKSEQGNAGHSRPAFPDGSPGRKINDRSKII